MVKADEEVANEQARVAKSIKDECDSDLSQAMPILNAAIAALDTISQNVIFSFSLFTLENHKDILLIIPTF